MYLQYTVLESQNIIQYIVVFILCETAPFKNYDLNKLLKSFGFIIRVLLV